MKLSRFRPSKEARIELSTTSMIDVVFLLLIFFLVTTTFLQPERQLKPNIKVERETASEIADDIEPAMIDIVRDQGIPVYRLGTLLTNDIEQIREVLAKFPDTSKGAFVRVSDNVPYGMAARAINVCKQSGFVTVSMVPLR